MSVHKKANFYDCIAPNNFQGLEIQSVEQRAHQARSREREARQQHMGPNIPSGPITPVDWEQRQSDWCAMEKLSKRRFRGGSIFQKGDGIVGE